MDSPDYLCPACWGNALEPDGADALVCRDCGAAWPLRKGIRFFVVPDRSWKAIVQDTVSLFMDFTANRDAAAELLGLDQQAELEAELEAENNVHVEKRHSLFRRAGSHLALPEGAKVLEVGGGSLMAAPWFVDRGHRVSVLEPVQEYMLSAPPEVRDRLTLLCGSATRLPLAPAQFDLVFCHATLHHVDDFGPLLREMARVAKPDGIVACFAEPFSAVGSNIERIRRTIPDTSFNHGKNERLPRFAEYHRAFAGAGIRGLKVFLPEDHYRVARKLGILPEKWLLPPVESPITLSAAVRARLALLHGTMCLWGRRGHAPIAAPPPVRREEYLFDPSDYTERRHRRSFVDIWKRLLSPEEITGEYVAGENDLLGLRRGFLPVECSRSGVPHRCMMAHGAFFLRPNEETRRVAILLRPEPGATLPLELALRMDDVSLGTRMLEEAGWQEVTWDLPAGALPAVAEFCLSANRLTRGPDGQARSVAIRRIGG